MLSKLLLKNWLESDKNEKHFGKNIGIRNGSSFHLTESFKSESAEAAGFCRVVQAYTCKLKNCKRMREYLW